MDPTLNGEDHMVWGDTKNPKCYAPDLVALRGRPLDDMFSNLFNDKVVEKWHKWIGHRFKKPHPRHGLQIYNDNQNLKITHLMTSIVAGFLPILSIIILYSVKPMRVRLAIVAAFNILFTSCLVGLTTSKKGEIFAATAA